ncbi:MAG: ParB/RepB/Spo0J family partition protein [Actinomycetes bacterium]|jgi:ParB family transcriptional regulator, chromosome partitioning protein
MSAARKGGLGRGLDALIPTTTIGDVVNSSGVIAGTALEVDINSVQPNSKQPRTYFDERALAELAASIKEVGVMQPPVVRDLGDGHYELIMGERRLRAAKLAGLKTIPVILRASSDNEMLREALLENIHRSELNPLEEAAAYQNLLNDFGYTHDELALKVGKSRPVITNTLRLLNLPAAVQRRVAIGILSAGHARALLSLTNAAEIEALANRIVAEGLSVRAVEEIVATSDGKERGEKAKRHASLSPQHKELADQLGNRFDTRVTIELGKQKGKITIEFADEEDLKRITQLFK